MSEPINLTNDEESYVKQVREELKQAISDDPLLLVKPLLSENDTLKQLAVSNQQKFLITLLFLVCAIAVAFYGLSKDIQFRYFFINSKGHVYETKGMDYPTANVATVTEAAKEIATQFHTWTYRNHRSVFTGLMTQCYPAIVNAYYTKLGNEGVFNVANQFNQHYDSVVTKAEIVQQAVIDSDGRLEWRVNLTLNERITGSTAPVEHTYDVVIDIRQVPLSESFTGLKCTRFDENYKGL